jgi:hypothetical protein
MVDCPRRCIFPLALDLRGCDAEDARRWLGRYLQRPLLQHSGPRLSRRNIVPFLFIAEPRGSGRLKSFMPPAGSISSRVRLTRPISSPDILLYSTRPPAITRSVCLQSGAASLGAGDGSALATSRISREQNRSAISVAAGVVSYRRSSPKSLSRTSPTYVAAMRSNALLSDSV